MGRRRHKKRGGMTLSSNDARQASSLSTASCGDHIVKHYLHDTQQSGLATRLTAALAFEVEGVEGAEESVGIGEHGEHGGARRARSQCRIWDTVITASIQRREAKVGP